MQILSAILPFAMFIVGSGQINSRTIHIQQNAKIFSHDLAFDFVLHRTFFSCFTLSLCLVILLPHSYYMLSCANKKKYRLNTIGAIEKKTSKLNTNIKICSVYGKKRMGYRMEVN